MANDNFFLGHLNGLNDDIFVPAVVRAEKPGRMANKVFREEKKRIKCKKRGSRLSGKNERRREIERDS